MCIFEGREYNSDTGRLINKYDIFICDLGEYDNNLGKKRPCVIVQSDKINNPKQNQYLVAPIRTEHSIEVTKENLQNIVDTRRELGRIYVPIEMSPGDFRFIDITRITSIASSNVLVYKESIINPLVKKKIDYALYELLFSDTHKSKESLVLIKNDKDKQKSKDIKDDEDNKFRKIPQIPNLPNNFNIIYADVKNGVISSKEGAVQLGIPAVSFDQLILDYEKYMHERKLVQLENQQIGINKAKKSGKHLGRPALEITEEFADAYSMWKNKEITAKTAMELLDMPSTSFYKMAKRYESEVLHIN